LPRGIIHGLGIAMYVCVQSLAFTPFPEYTWCDHNIETALTYYDKDCAAGVCDAKSKRKIAVVGDRCVDEVYCYDIIS
jgi:hypothetical protein